MKKLAIIGSKGMLGSDLVNYLSSHFSVVPISKDNYSQFISVKFEIVINANGNSKRFWANKNPLDDFIASTASVYNTIFDFPSNLYIYISSPDVYENHTGSEYTHEDNEIKLGNLDPYGFHKYLSELIVKKYKEKFLILRSAMILGKNLKKGPFYDILNDKEVFVTSQTKLQIITSHAIAEIIEILLNKQVENETLNVGGIGTFDFKKISEYSKKKIKYSSQAEKQVYEMNINKLKNLYPELKQSEEYLQEFLHELAN